MALPLLNPLQVLHERAEAAFLPYGTEVQIVESYGVMEAEYAAIRKGVALMDVPQRTVVILTGRDRLTFLQNKVTNDTKALVPGRGCYAYLLNLKGRIVMDMNILQTEEATLVEMDRRLLGDFLRTMEKYLFGEDVRILDGLQQMGRLTVLGPKAGTLLGKVMAGGVEELVAPLSHVRRMLGRVPVTVVRNDMAGEAQYELIVPRDRLVELWQALPAAGGHEGESDWHVRAIGWSAFNVARIEAGTPVYGIDITDHYLPMETGPWYSRAVSVTKGCYLGQEIVARMHAHKTVARMLVGLRVKGAKLPVAGTDIFDPAQGAAQVGMVTSSCLSPMLGNVPVALGYVKKAFATVGKKVEVLAEGGRVVAEVAELPLWTK
jgi:folate-binding protein YgfZ